MPLTTKAAELTWKAENAFQAARRLNSFVAGEIETGMALPSARFCLESGVGNSESRALLLVAMARASGLPARRIGGLVFQDGDFVPHHWAEIWLGDQESWTPFDPTTNEAGQIGASHIALWESGDIQSTAIQVKNYAPRAPRKVAYFNTELTWPVGEQRVYAILRDGERIGTEVARVGDMQFLGNQEVYTFEARATLQDGEKTLEMKSSCWSTRQACRSAAWSPGTPRCRSRPNCVSGLPCISPSRDSPAGRDVPHPRHLPDRPEILLWPW